MYYELGHPLDDLCGLSENEAFKKYYGSLTAGDIKIRLVRIRLYVSKRIDCRSLCGIYVQFKTSPDCDKGGRAIE